MMILVDADACPVIPIIEQCAGKYQLPCVLICDTNHILKSDTSQIVVVGEGPDAVDFKLISLCKPGDIVCTQDYGVAAMALGKKCLVIHQSGRWYTDENIGELLMARHLAKKARKSSKKNHLKGPSKRTLKDDKRFEESFERMIQVGLNRKK